MTAATLTRPIEFPPGYDAAAILAPVRHSAILERTWSAAGAQRRRAATWYSPLHFNLVYLGHHLVDQQTGHISFAEGHMELYRGVQCWRPEHPGALAVADNWAVVAPRRFGKSTATTTDGGLWALCHGHRRVLVVFSHTAKQAWANHVERIKEMLTGKTEASRRLLADFPHMRIVAGGGANRLLLAGGGAIVAAGLMDSNLGLVVGGDRPDLGVFDDMLPGTRTDPDNVAAIKEIITTVALPMFAGHAAILITGTVFDKGDLLDDVVCLALGRTPRSRDRGQWLRGRGFRYTYIEPDWPQRWSQEVLAAKWAANPKTFALEFRPDLLDTVEVQRHFTAELFETHRMPHYHPIRRVIMTDHATSGRAGTKRNDKTAIAVLCSTSVAGRVVVEHVEAGRMDVTQLHARCKQLHQVALARDGVAPDVWGWERNAGHELGVDSMRKAGALPTGASLLPFDVHTNKDARIEALHERYNANAVWHRHELPDFEAQAIAWTPGASGPGVDDMLDAVSSGVRLLLTGHAGDKTS